MQLYQYQQRIDELLRAGRSVILQAPTGAGKTRAALFPFLDGWRNAPTAFPRQCIYAVPMRVLANQFEAEYKQIVADYTNRFGLLGSVSIQTGARPADRRFEADLVFTTIDQVLSSFLTIPYSLGNRQANLNAGALVGSYLVFDEFHLFPVDEQGNGALATTLHTLKLLKGIVPFVLMTATFSRQMIARLADELDAVAVIPTQDEIDGIPSQQGKQRRYRYQPHQLDAVAVVDDFVAAQRERVIAICNTVDRAQALADALRTNASLSGVTVELLHSRFYSSDRNVKEDWIRREFGEDRSARTIERCILVATQVVEVGLNITCEVLHTEVAPAAAIVQRAGRCARFRGEAGEVVIYAAPVKEDDTPDYAPYLEEGQRAVCERTQAALLALPSEGEVWNYHAELALVDQAHGAADELLLDTLHTKRATLQQAAQQVLDQQDRSAARELIRDIDTRTVIVHPDPSESSVPNPLRYEGIGLRRGALLRWYEAVQQQAWDMQLDWIAKIAHLHEAEPDNDAPEQRRRLETQWHALRPALDAQEVRAAQKDLASGGWIVALHPQLVQYDRNLGFRLAPGARPADTSPLASNKSSKEDFGPICHETYAEHIAGLLRVYVRGERNRTAAAQRRLEQRFELPFGTIDRAIRLMFAVHDLGKLDRVWQEWAHRWQARVSALRNDPTLLIADDYMAAHTDYDSQHAAEREAQRKVTPRRPHHAAESARAGRTLLNAVSRNCDALYVGLVSAIICHHSAKLRADHGPFVGASAAKRAFDEALSVVGLFDDAELRASNAKVDWRFTPATDLDEELVDLRRTDDLLFYLLLVRILRLCDQGSQSHEE